MYRLRSPAVEESRSLSSPPGMPGTAGAGAVAAPAAGAASEAAAAVEPEAGEAGSDSRPRSTRSSLPDSSLDKSKRADSCHIPTAVQHICNEARSEVVIFFQIDTKFEHELAVPNISSNINSARLLYNGIP